MLSIGNGCGIFLRVASRARDLSQGFERNRKGGLEENNTPTCTETLARKRGGGKWVFSFSAVHFGKARCEETFPNILFFLCWIGKWGTWVT